MKVLYFVDLNSCLNILVDEWKKSHSKGSYPVLNPKISTKRPPAPSGDRLSYTYFVLHNESLFSEIQQKCCLLPQLFGPMGWSSGDNGIWTLSQEYLGSKPW